MKKLIVFLSVFFMPCLVSAMEMPVVLNENDIEVYKKIFDLQEHEKISQAQKLEKQLSDNLLMNEVLFQRYTSKTYHTKGKEVINWMSKYNNTPNAVRMEKLAKIKKVSVKKAKLPQIVTGATGGETAQSENWTSKNYSGSIAKDITKFKKAIRAGSTKRARLLLESKNMKKHLTESDYGRLAGRLAYIYYTNGEYELAKKWGFIAADSKSEYGLWTMGLLYFKEEKFIESEKYFGRILDLKQINNARKTEAAFWAGRAAEAKDDWQKAVEYWKIGAKYPMTFYGALSTTMLDEIPNYEFFEQDFVMDDANELLQYDYGKRAIALLQIGKKNLAEQYLKLMVTAKASDKTLHAIDAIATTYALPSTAVLIAGVVRDRGILEIDNNIIYSAQYPLPDWEPMGGWSIDRALLLAITKQESGFKTNAKSGVGANGLMQLMPTTAKMIVKQNKMKMSDIDITNPSHNMFLGQQHIVDLLANPNINNNIIKMLAAYNAGLGMVMKFEKSFDTYDPLLYIESFPAYETRNYIKRVMSNLWLYRARLNQPLTSLEELADGTWPLYSSEDDYVQQQIADRLSI